MNGLVYIKAALELFRADADREKKVPRSLQYTRPDEEVNNRCHSVSLPPPRLSESNDIDGTLRGESDPVTALGGARVRLGHLRLGARGCQQRRVRGRNGATPTENAKTVSQVD